MGFISFMGGEPLINGNSNDVQLKTNFSESQTFHMKIVSPVNVKGWISFHSGEGNPLITGEP